MANCQLITPEKDDLTFLLEQGDTAGTMNS